MKDIMNYKDELIEALNISDWCYFVETLAQLNCDNYESIEVKDENEGVYSFSTNDGETAYFKYNEDGLCKMIQCENCGDWIPEDKANDTCDGCVCNDCFESDYIVCDDCYEVIRKTDAYETHDGNHICESCKDDYYYYCEECDELYHNDDICEVDGRYICEDCREDIAERCNDCGDWHLSDNMNYIESRDCCVCNDCYCENYYCCDDCGGIFHLDDMNYCEHDDGTYCDRCYRDHANEFIYSYHNYHGGYRLLCAPEDNHISKSWCFGIEVENEGDRDNAEYVVNNIGHIFHCEEDGSLDCGFEMVSQPMTWNYFMSEYENMKSVFDYLISQGHRAHDTSTCGLHIHINRAAFKNDDAINRAIAIVHYFQENNEVIARRSGNGYCQYRKISKCITKKEIVENIPKEGHGVAVNCGYHSSNSNRSTIEFRIFKGTLNAETIRASIEFVFNVVRLANSDRKRWKYNELLKGEYISEYAAEREQRGYTIDREKYIDFQAYDIHELKQMLETKRDILKLQERVNENIQAYNTLASMRHMVLLGGAR